MWRLYDWTCQRCGADQESAVEFPQGDDPPNFSALYCRHCKAVSTHERHRVNLPGKWLGDRPNAAIVSGGKFDTAGRAPVPRLPEFNGDSYSDFKDFVHTKDYKEVKEYRSAKKAENKVKQKRTKLIKAGANVDVRHHPLPGDPKF